VAEVLINQFCRFWIRKVVCKNLAGLAALFFSGDDSGAIKSQPTKRALDGWVRCGFSSIFLPSSFFCLLSESSPTRPVTQTVGWQRQRANAKPFWFASFVFVIGSKIQNLFSDSIFSSSRLFVLSAFISSAKFLFGFIESLKLASRFFACVSVNFGFERLRRFLFAKFVVGFVGFQNRRVFYQQNFR